MTSARRVPVSVGVGGAVVIAVAGAVTWVARRKAAMSIALAGLAAAGWLGAFAVGRRRRR